MSPKAIQLVLAFSLLIFAQAERDQNVPRLLGRRSFGDYGLLKSVHQEYLEEGYFEEECQKEYYYEEECYTEEVCYEEEICYEEEDSWEEETCYEEEDSWEEECEEYYYEEEYCYEEEYYCEEECQEESCEFTRTVEFENEEFSSHEFEYESSDKFEYDLELEYRQEEECEDGSYIYIDANGEFMEETRTGYDRQRESQIDYFSESEIEGDCDGLEGSCRAELDYSRQSQSEDWYHNERDENHEIEVEFEYEEIEGSLDLSTSSSSKTDYNKEKRNDFSLFIDKAASFDE